MANFKQFIYVSATNNVGTGKTYTTEAEKWATEINPYVGSTGKFYKTIIFREATGEIYNRGTIFGVNKSMITDVTDLKSLKSFLITNGLVSQSGSTYTWTLDATKVAYNKSGDNYIASATNVSAAIKALDATIKSHKDTADTKELATAQALADQNSRLETAETAIDNSLGLTLAYDSTNKKIQLKNASGTVVADLDSTPFVKDGMLEKVELVNQDGSGTVGRYLKITWNTDAAKSITYLNVSDLLNVYDAANIKLTSSYAKASTYSEASVKSGVSMDTAIGIIMKGIELALALEGEPDDATSANTIWAAKNEAAAKYTKPSGGIPKTDMASAVQTSLGKADSALQPSDIASWAKASSKPSYKTSEVTEETNLYFTNARAQSALSGHTGDTTIHITSTERTTWNGKYAKPSGGIPKSDLASAVQTSLGKADTALQSADIADIVNAESNANTYTDNALDAMRGESTDATSVLTLYGIQNLASSKYTKPSGGIPKTDLASAVQTSLGKADSALQPSDIADWAKASNKPSYTTSEVTEGTNKYFTDARAQSALSGHTGDTTKHITADERTAWNGKYTKPSTGIPYADLSASVEASLTKADSALQSISAEGDDYVAASVTGTKVSVETTMGTLSVKETTGQAPSIQCDVALGLADAVNVQSTLNSFIQKYVDWALENNWVEI